MKLLITLALICLASPAFAQVQPVYVATPTGKICLTGRTCAPLTDVHGAQSVIPWQQNSTLPVLGSLAFGSISGTYATCLSSASYSGRMRGILFKNDTDKTLIASLNGGTTDHVALGSGDGLFVPFSQVNLWVASANISIKHAGSAPTSGSVYCTVLPEN